LPGNAQVTRRLWRGAVDRWLDFLFRLPVTRKVE